MRIIYCIPEISHPGGIGRVTTIKANYLSEHGYEVYIVTSGQFDEPDFFELNSEVHHIDLGIGFQAGMDNHNIVMKVIKKLGKMKRYRQKLTALIEDIKPDIVVSTFSNDSDFLYKLKDGSKKVLEFHFSHDGYKSQIKYASLSLSHKLLLLYRIKKQERLAHKYDAFVVLTHEDANDWKGYTNLHVIPNMLTFESEEVAPLTHKRVIAVGRLDFQKKFDRLINIWAEINKQCPDWELDIFGQGPDRDKLVQQIDKLNLSSSIQIKAPTAYIKEEYLKSSLLLMTSTYEGWGLVLTEAMTCGIPCVSYTCKCGPKDIIDEGKNGYAVPEGDADLFVKRALEIMKNRDVRFQMGESAKRKSYSYQKEKIMGLWIDLFKTMIQA